MTENATDREVQELADALRPHWPTPAPERLIEVTIGLWPDDDPPGQRPPRLAAAIVKALHDEGYEIREAGRA